MFHHLYVMWNELFTSTVTLINYGHQFNMYQYVFPFFTATNKFEQLFVCINENLVPIELNVRPQQTESNVKCSRTPANITTNKTDDNNSTQNKDTTTNDMENLYWHTHGSLLWQRWIFIQRIEFHFLLPFFKWNFFFFLLFNRISWYI